jgi:hypothetical protein
MPSRLSESAVTVLAARLRVRVLAFALSGDSSFLYSPRALRIVMVSLLHAARRAVGGKHASFRRLTLVGPSPHAPLSPTVVGTLDPSDGCVGPLASIDAGERFFLTSIAFIVFCIWPIAATTLYGWLPALFGR